MSEKEDVFSSKIKYNGIFSFPDLYKFAYDLLAEEGGLSVAEEKYAEKISGDSKDIDFEWKGSRKVDDYFKHEIKVSVKVIGLTKVEITQDGNKIKSNKGSIEIKIKGTLVKDYDGKYETSASMKFMRAIYEKWIIASRLNEIGDKLAGVCDDFLAQTKAYLDLSGKK